MRIVKLSEVLKHRKEFIQISDDQSYKLCRVQTNRKGVLLREIKIGALIQTKKQQVCKKGDFIVAEMDAKVGGYGFIPEDLDGSIVSSHYFLFDVDFGKIRKEYLEAIIQTEIIQEQIKAKGSTNYSAIRPKDVLNWEIPLATLEKQKEIEKNFLKIKEASINLLVEIESQKSLLSQLKQSILQEAIQGKLTEEWRALRQAQQPPLEPASELLKRIQAEKAKLIKEKKIKKEKPLPPITDSEKPFELPEGWEWCRLGEICSKTGSGSTPSGGKSIYQNEGIKFIRSQNVYDDGLRLEDVAFISEQIHQKMNGTIVRPEDLLLNITGGSIGRCCIVPKSFDEGNINQHVAIIRPFFEFIGYFIHKVICSPYFQKQIIKAQTGAGREGLPKNKMDNILIGLPEEEEQKAIVEKVESLMEKCRTLEEEISQSEQHAQMLMQAVLKEAFEMI